MRSRRLQSHHGRNPERTGHDRGVRSAAATSVACPGPSPFIVAVSDGVMLCATRICGSRRTRAGTSALFPCKLCTTRLVTSRRYQARARADGDRQSLRSASRINCPTPHLLENPFHVAQIRFQFAQDFVDQVSVLHYQRRCASKMCVLCPDRFGDALLHLKNPRVVVTEIPERSGSRSHWRFDPACMW